MRYILVILTIAVVACIAPVSHPKANITLKQIQTDAFQIDRNAVAKANCAWFVEAVN